MWKHKNFINLQLHAGPQPFSIAVNGTTFSIQRLSDSMVTGEETWSYNASINTDIYSISGNTVVWNDGTILQYNGVDVLPTDDIIGIEGNPGIYTTRSATPTLTFKHFYNAGTIGSGTVKFRHYSQTEPSSGNVIKAGTYQFIEKPNFPSGLDIREKITVIINTLIDDDVYGNQKTTTDIQVFASKVANEGYINIFNVDPHYGISLTDFEYSSEDGNVFYAYSNTAKLRTIVIATDQTVSNELYKWAITDGNLVKLS